MMLNWQDAYQTEHSENSVKYGNQKVNSHGVDRTV
jgi:hypothetical protein